MSVPCYPYTMHRLDLLDERKSLYSSTYVCTMLPVHYAQARLVRRA